MSRNVFFSYISAVNKAGDTRTCARPAGPIPAAKAL